MFKLHKWTNGMKSITIHPHTSITHSPSHMSSVTSYLLDPVLEYCICKWAHTIKIDGVNKWKEFIVFLPLHLNIHCIYCWYSMHLTTHISTETEWLNWFHTSLYTIVNSVFSSPHATFLIWPSTKFSFISTKSQNML